jgi:CHAD domain-containing protein
MTTDWTAIRRRLAVGGTAYRPPWGGRKAGHRSIVAPVAATVAATVALGVGVALAKAERERRSARLRLLDRRLGLAPCEQLADGMQRMTLGQVDLALEQLRALGDGARAEKAVHEIRKALKRLRAVLRLLEDELGEKAFARENEALRQAAQRLSAARDAEVMLSTLDALISRHPRLKRRGSVVKLRRRLLAERAAAERRALGDPAIRQEVLAELYAFRRRVAAWSLRDRDGVELVESDLRRLYRQGRKRHRRLSRGKGERTRAMHEWRKRVKDLRYAAEILDRRASGSRRARGGGGGGERARARREAERLRRLARRADELGERLGEEHDLAVLAERIRAGRSGGGQGTWRMGRRTRRTLLAQIARRRRSLRRRALREGERLYRPTPSAFMRRVRAAHTSGRHGLS